MADNLDRRALLAAGIGFAAATTTIGISPAFAQGDEDVHALDQSTEVVKGPFVQPELGFETTALDPVISSQTMVLHYEKHHAGYYNKLNKLVQGTPYEAMSLVEVVRQSKQQDLHQDIFNNAGQALNHVQYWETLVPGGPAEPDDILKAAIDESFGRFDVMVNQIVEQSGSLFGSGWIWLVRTPENKLSIVKTRNGNTPIAEGGSPVLNLDLWEHAYYLDYQNRRKDHVRALLEKSINWRVVSSRFQDA
ncbi:MAG TPA: superoxide dismutase [Rhodospirillaceae bacterium]|nr:superoxide dismutase [Alphaproteobacteria bacterium]OUT42626.1 MAG: hypothetical protein CBB62_03710 [Micavibrio sp. TMED2]HCI46739.1 superoxide dismutase [Rhodospirillaceae bacterium]MAS46992.1 superoxide dismutase [Alphaproteobacteria bacterium]MAX95086.1 superoxide dismutase [Alphaproteobacteria bacterium]|tara:strand:- start:5038 stop:5784 length:747 start_codon:yes stop_codon:yes gene_type:complete